MSFYDSPVPSTVDDLFSIAGLTSSVVSWGKRIPAPAQGPTTGVYIVASERDVEVLDSAIPTCPISPVAVGTLLAMREELTVDRERPDVAALTERLAATWCSDEVILYIGRAGPRKKVEVSELSDRVQEYYDTPLGARSPHAGGWPIKTLAVLQDLFVHFAYCVDVAKVEDRMLDAFATRMSDGTRASLYDSERPMPFANLTNSMGRKNHGIRGARAPKASKKPKVTTRTPFDGELPRSSQRQGGVRSSQRVTAADINKGQLRIPRSSKDLLPSVSSDVTIAIRGSTKVCRWNPRLGPDQERSGVLGIGKELMRLLVHDGDVLHLTKHGATIHLD